MADIDSEPTSARCSTNATNSASIVDREQLLDFYQQWCDKYDEDFRSEHYIGPKIAADNVCQLIPAAERSGIVVLDAAAGTGLVGFQLFRNGFTTIDALDASDAMLANLRRKNVYRNIIQAVLGGQEAIGVDDAQYDVITMSGGFVPGHVPMSALHDFIRMCKPGGFIVIVMRYEFLQSNDYANMEPLMQSLEHETNRWKLIKRAKTNEYLLDKQGIVFIFKKNH